MGRTARRSAPQWFEDGLWWWDGEQWVRTVDPLGGEQAAEPRWCLNCAGQLGDLRGRSQLFCSELCRQTAELVRYGRRTRRDARYYEDPMVREAIHKRLAHILSGGYQKEARRLDPATRAAVIERDGGRCALCGGSGTEIDHMAGDSADLDDLQLLCHACHQAKTEESFRPVEASSPEEEMAAQFWERVSAAQPLRNCDDDERWPTRWRELQAERHASARSLKWVTTDEARRLGLPP